MILTIVFFSVFSATYNAPIPTQNIVNIHRRTEAPISVVADEKFFVSWNFDIDLTDVMLVGIQASKDNKTYEIANKITHKNEFKIIDETLKKCGIQLNNTNFSIDKVPRHLDGYTLKLLFTYNPANALEPKTEYRTIGEISLLKTLGTTERRKGALLIIPLTILGIMTLLAVIMIMVWQIKTYKQAQRSAMLLTDLGDDEDKKKKASYVVLAQKILGPDDIDENGLPKKSNWV